MERTPASPTISPIFPTSSVMETEGGNPLLVIFRTIFIIIDVFLTVFGNIVSIIVINRARGFSDSVQVLMTSLCLADLGVGLTLLFSAVVSSWLDRWVFGDPWCKVTAGSLAVCLSMSVFSLLGVSVDRLVAIRWPLRHPVLITKRRVKVGCIALWVTSVVIAAGNVMLHLDDTIYLPVAAMCYLYYSLGAAGIANEIFITTLLCVLPLVTIVAIYANLLRISAGHQRRLRNNMHLAPATSHANEASLSNEESSAHRSPESGSGNTSHRGGAVNRKALTMFLVVSLGFAASWTPHFATRLYGVITGGDLPPWLQFLHVWLAMSNSFWNVIIYTMMNGSFRREVIRLLGCRKCCINQRVTPQFTNSHSRGDNLPSLTI